MADSTNEEPESTKEDLGDLISRAEEVISRLDKATAGIEGTAQTTQTRANDANTSAQQAEQAKKSAQTVKDEIDGLKQAATENGETVKSLASNAEGINEALNNQKKELEETSAEAKRLRDTIEHLLPGATSAGLASAFRERKASFKWPKRIWGVVFVASILSLVLIAYIDPMSLERESASYQTIIPYILERLPFIVPLVWLAIYAGRRHSQALRLEEDYAHKETLSKSFEGYKSQLLEIEEGAQEKEKTLDLIDRTLTALTLHPGRIYQGRHEDISPLDPLKGVFRRKGEPKANDDE